MKKKKSRKQASDFAKELDDLDAENDEEAGMGGGVEVDGDLGDDVFESSRVTDGGADTGKEAWVLEGRDPTYPEVSRWLNSSIVRFMSLRIGIAAQTILHTTPHS